MTEVICVTPYKDLAQFDRDRNGILIHADLLQNSAFAIGDRFAVKKGQRELFALKIVRDDNGSILFDKNGIFIERSRRIDILLGGLFQEYVVDLKEQHTGAVIVRPLPEMIPS
jgi:hypothetical protein